MALLGVANVQVNVCSTPVGVKGMLMSSAKSLQSSRSSAQRLSASKECS